MKNLLFLAILLFYFTINLSAENSIPQLKNVQLEVIGKDELTLTSFEDEARTLNFSNDFRNMKLQKKISAAGSRAIAIPIMVTGTVVIGGTLLIGTFMKSSKYPNSTEDNLQIAGGVAIGAVFIAAGTIILANAGSKPKTRKQKQLDGIKRFEGY